MAPHVANRKFQTHQSHSPSPSDGHSVGHKPLVSVEKLENFKSSSPAPQLFEGSILKHKDVSHKYSKYLSPQFREVRDRHGRTNSLQQIRRSHIPAHEVGTRALSPYPTSRDGRPRLHRGKRLGARVDGAAQLNDWENIFDSDLVNQPFSTGLGALDARNDNEWRQTKNDEQQVYTRGQYLDPQWNEAQCLEHAQSSHVEPQTVNALNQASSITTGNMEEVSVTETQDQNTKVHSQSQPNNVVSNQSRTSRLTWAQVASGGGQTDRLCNPVSVKASAVCGKTFRFQAGLTSNADLIPCHIEGSSKLAPNPLRHKSQFSGDRNSLSESRSYNGTIVDASPESTETEAQHSASRSTEDKMKTIKETILHSIGQQPSTEKFAVFSISTWEIEDFLQERYPQGVKQDLGAILTITGTAKDAYLTTVRKYLSRMWPRYPIMLLNAVQNAVSGVDRRNRKIRKQGAMIDVDLVNSKVSVSGTEGFIVAIAQQLAWLVASLQATTADLAYCHASLCKSLSPSSELGAAFTIVTETDPVSSSEAGSCWNPLIKRSVVAIGFPIPARFHREMGLEIPLEIMACLGGTTVAVSFKGGYLLKGRSTMFIPVWKRSNSVQWHLVVEKEGTIKYKDAERLCPWRLSEKELRKRELLRTRAFLGWCTESSNKFATNEYSYRDINFSDARKQKKRFVHLIGATLSISRIVSAGANIAIGTSTAPFSMTASNMYQRRLEDAKNLHVILQDMRTRRAWHIDGERLILQIILQREYRVNGKEPGYIILDANAPDYVRQMTIKNAEVGLIKEDYGYKGPRIQVFREVFAEICDRLQAICADLDNSYTVEDRQRWNPNNWVQGYEYMEILRDKAKPTKKDIELKETCGGWPAFARDIDAIVLFGVNFGEIIQASPQSDLCGGFQRVPEENDYLAVEGSILKRLFDESGAGEDQQHLTPSKRKWHRSEHLFEPCPPKYSNENSRCKCERIQILLPKASNPFKCFKPPGILPPNCAVIFGQGKGIWRKIFESISQSTTHSATRKSGTGSQQIVCKPRSAIELASAEAKNSSPSVWRAEQHSQTTTANHSPVLCVISDEKPSDVPDLLLPGLSALHKESSSSIATYPSTPVSMNTSFLGSETFFRTPPTTAATTPITVSPNCSQLLAEKPTDLILSEHIIDQHLHNQLRQSNGKATEYSQTSPLVSAKHIHSAYMIGGPSRTDGGLKDTPRPGIENSTTLVARAEKPHNSQYLTGNTANSTNQLSTFTPQLADHPKDDRPHNQVLTYAEVLRKSLPSPPVAVEKSQLPVPPTESSNKPRRTNNCSARSYTITARSRSFESPPHSQYGLMSRAPKAPSQKRTQPQTNRQINRRSQHRMNLTNQTSNMEQSGRLARPDRRGGQNSSELHNI